MPIIPFDNTEIAFASKNDADLNRSYMLFTLVSRTSWVKIGKVLTNAALGLHLPISGLIKATIFKQFCGGENIKDCAHTIKSLGDYNIGTILDYSVEGKDNEADFDYTAQEIKETIKEAVKNKNIPFGVFKPTGMIRFALLEKVTAKETLTTSETQEWQRAKDRVKQVCNSAAEVNIPIFIDAEDSWIQGAIDDLTEEMMSLFNKEKVIVYNTLQMYRHDRIAYLKQLHTRAVNGGYKIGLKLVRGAYMEKERERAAQMGYQDPINKTKADTDRDYDAALDFCVEHINDISICAGTHNEQSSQHLVNLMEKHKITPNDKRIYFSQLLGMSDHISYNLARLDYNVAKYVPYGPIRNVLPYLIRRAEENTSVKGQTGRELSLLIKEKQRRKKTY
ncbi:MAG: proline dehydrogenase family protein [Bacteroidia bacterium]|nr:proline dehydrogenase family protein [Bacteroidia bacterium]MCZ2247589.1 proline dehydrogenase family protein [Bacteroidia bacterium]